MEDKQKEFKMAIVKRTDWTKEEMSHLLSHNERFLIKALAKMFEFQTADEQDAESTHYRNRVGFNGADAKVLTSINNFFAQRGFLTVKQVALARVRMMKYAGQLAKISNGEITMNDVTGTTFHSNNRYQKRRARRYY